MKKIFFILFVLISQMIFANNFDVQNLNFRFTENKGQIVDFDKNIRNEFLFYSKSDNLDIYFRKSGITYIFKKGDKIPNTLGLSKEDETKLIKEYLNKKTLFYRLDVDFVNPSQNISVEGSNQSKSYTNFYLAHCPNGILNVKSYNKIVYKNVYEGIDFIFYFKDNKLKYDIVLNNSLNLNKIKLKFNDAKNINLNNNKLKILSPVGEIIETLPESYYINNKKQKTSTIINYKLSKNIVSFISKGNNTNSLIIDPQISWTTYYDDCFWNGSGSNVDVKGNQFVITSYGFNDDFPTLNPGGSAYFQNSTSGSGDYRILKFDTDGVRQWATYYGGTDYENYCDVKISYSGDIYIAGHTESSDIPVQNSTGYYDGTYNAGTYGGGTVIIRFNSNGVRQWGTHYDYVAYPLIDIDHNNNVYVFGRSEYDNPPVQSLSGAYNQSTVSMDGSGSSHSSDIFIVKFNSSNTRLWATNLGSTCDEYLEDIYIGTDNYVNILAYGDNYYGTGIITADPGGGAYYDNTLGIGSGGSSTDRDDALIYRITPSGSLFWGTAFSGTANENMQQGRITADASNNVYILGETASTDLPFTDLGNGAYYDNTFVSYGTNSFNPFIARFNSGGVLQWCTYFGTHGLGYGMNFSHYIGFNNNDNLILVSTDGGGVGGSKPLVPRAGDYNATLQVYMGVYIAEFNSNFDVDWSTYYAGTEDRHSLGDCALSSNSCGYELYMTTNWEMYNSGATPPWVKPTSSSYQDTTWLTTGNRSGLITRFSNVNSETPNGIIASPQSICPGNSSILSVDGGSLGTGANWQWYTDSCGGTLVGSGDSLIVFPTSTTTYYVRAEGTCNTTSCVNAQIDLNTTSTEANSISANQQSICTGDSATLTINGGSLGTGAEWYWYSDTCGSTSIGNGTSITVSPTTPTTYYVRAEGDCDTTNCTSITIGINTASTDPTGVIISNSSICYGDTAILTVNGGSLGNGADWQWSEGSCGSGTIVGTGDTLFVSPSSTTVYYVRAVSGCDTTICVSGAVTVNQLPNVSFTGLDKNYCSNDTIINLLGNNAPNGTFYGNNISDNGDGTAQFSPIQSGSQTIIYEYTDNNNCFNADTQTVIIYNNPKIDTAIVNNVTCSDYNDGEILINVSGGSPDYQYYWTGPNNFTASNEHITNLSQGKYNITVTDKNSCQTNYSINLISDEDACLEIPTVFTPNNDGVNDNWEIKGISSIDDINIEIYNRWGDLIFSFDGSGSEYNTNRWDGTYNGKELPISSYVFIIDLKNNKKPIQGIVTIKK